MSGEPLALKDDRTRQNELRSVNVQLIHVIKKARCWADIVDASDAMFHARMIWEPYNAECLSHEGLNTEGGCDER